MAKAITILKSSDNQQEFEGAPMRFYFHNSPPLKNVIDIAEKWLVVNGEVTFVDDLSREKRVAKKDDIIILPKNSQFSEMKFDNNFCAKQFIDNTKERDRHITNIKINYLIIQTIFEIIGEYDDFTSVPVPIDWIFEAAKNGDLFNNQNAKNCYNIVEDVINNLIGRTGIQKAVWFGERRLKTGLKYTNPNLAKEKQYTTKNIDEYEVELANDTTGLYEDIILDPLGIENTNLYDENIHNLFSLFIFGARKIKKEEEIFVNVFPANIRLRQPRNSGKSLNNKGMPPYVRYGTELSAVIRRLFWSTSVGYENRLKLKGLDL